MKNRAAFDSDEPGREHFDRFNERLSARKPGRTIRVRHVLQVAASIAVILASAWVIFDKSKSGDKVAATDMPAEVFEAEVYYMRQVDDKYREIEGFQFDSDQEKALLLEELKDLDVYQQKLISDLEANPTDERVINAMIRHYQLKLEIMDQIIDQLNQIKYHNTEKNENANI